MTPSSNDPAQQSPKGPQATILQVLAVVAVGFLPIIVSGNFSLASLGSLLNFGASTPPSSNLSASALETASLASTLQQIQASVNVIRDQIQTLIQQQGTTPPPPAPTPPSGDQVIKQAALGAPTITSLTPTSGPVGTVINVLGSGFTATDNTVTFGGLSASGVTSSDGMMLSFAAPSGAPDGNYNVSVTNANGTSNTSLFVVASTGGTGGTGRIWGRVWNDANSDGVMQTFNNNAGTEQYIRDPSITCGTHSQPLSVPITLTGPTTLTMTAKLCADVSPNQYPYFDSQNGSSVATVPAGQYTISATAPSGWQFTTPNPATVTVTSGGTQFVAIGLTQTSQQQGSVTITSLAPASGPPGTAVTVTGTNFTATGNTVSFGGTPLSASSSDGTHLTFTVPAGVSTGSTNVSVANINGVSSFLTFTVTGGGTGGGGTPPPQSGSVTIAAIYPKTSSGGSTKPIALAGQGFIGSSAVNTVHFGSFTINNVKALKFGYGTVQGSTLTFYVPGGATAGTYPIWVENGLGVSNAVQFTLTADTPAPTPPPITPQSCSTSGVYLYESDPSNLQAGSTFEIDLLGRGFVAGSNVNTVRIGGQSITNTTGVISEDNPRGFDKIKFFPPATMAPGMYDVTVTNSRGTSNSEKISFYAAGANPNDSWPPTPPAPGLPPQTLGPVQILVNPSKPFAFSYFGGGTPSYLYLQGTGFIPSGQIKTTVTAHWVDASGANCTPDSTADTTGQAIYGVYDQYGQPIPFGGITSVQSLKIATPNLATNRWYNVTVTSANGTANTIQVWDSPAIITTPGLPGGGDPGQGGTIFTPISSNQSFTIVEPQTPSGTLVPPGGGSFYTGSEYIVAINGSRMLDGVVFDFGQTSPLGTLSPLPSASSLKQSCFNVSDQYNAGYNCTVYLDIPVPANQAPGTYYVQGRNPDGTKSNILSFTIAPQPASWAGIPVVSAGPFIANGIIIPYITEGHTYTFDVFGANFKAGAVAYRQPEGYFGANSPCLESDGTPTGGCVAVPTTFISSTHLQYRYKMPPPNANGVQAYADVVQIYNPDHQLATPSVFLSYNQVGNVTGPNPNSDTPQESVTPIAGPAGTTFTFNTNNTGITSGTYVDGSGNLLLDLCYPGPYCIVHANGNKLTITPTMTFDPQVSQIGSLNMVPGFYTVCSASVSIISGVEQVHGLNCNRNWGIEIK